MFQQLTKKTFMRKGASFGLTLFRARICSIEGYEMVMYY